MIPAVEILQFLAGSLLSQRPQAFVQCMRAASFDRFLPIDQDCRVMDACHELVSGENGRLSSRLLTTGKIPGTTMKRTKVHAVVEFAVPGGQNVPLPMDRAASLEGLSCEISAKRLYAELVPFGPAYRNIVGRLFLTENGAIGKVLAADHDTPSSPLGSPFPFDGALHAACAWGQRFHRLVAFPVGFEERIIVRPTAPGVLYAFRIVPLPPTGGTLRFDIWIYDLDGGLRESIRGVTMKDVSGGRISPPRWFTVCKNVLLPNIQEHCQAVSLVDMQTIEDFAPLALSSREHDRYEKMGRKRQQGFLAGRLALKHLARKMAGGDQWTPASDIHTIMPDEIHPACPVSDDQVPMFCSLSHDARFAIAVAAREKIGVDVERISERVVKARHIFMDQDEAALVDVSPLGSLEATLRVWSIKEGVAKATDRSLAESWRTAKIDRIGSSRSHLSVDGVSYMAYHDVVHPHVFTLVKKDEGEVAAGS